MRSRFLATAAIIVAAILPASGVGAQEDPKVNCDDQLTQFDMNYCANEEYVEADTALNAAYKTVMSHMAETDKELTESMGASYAGAVETLKKAQRAWIGYRDGQCQLSGYSARGGSMEPMLVSQCLAGLTKKRTQELKDLLTEY